MRSLQHSLDAAAETVQTARAALAQSKSAERAQVRELRDALDIARARQSLSAIDAAEIDALLDSFCADATAAKAPAMIKRTASPMTSWLRI